MGRVREVAARGSGVVARCAGHAAGACATQVTVSSTDKALALREGKRGGGVYLEGVSEHTTTSLPEVLDLRGNRSALGDVLD